jgi:hypothetical protein
METKILIPGKHISQYSAVLEGTLSSVQVIKVRQVEEKG